MTNQRKHKRVPITGNATLQFEDKGTMQSVQTLLGSISLGGIGLYADDPLEIDTNVSLTINIISNEGIKTDSIKGSVIYHKDINGMFFLGIQFNKEINPKNQPLLYEHIQKALALG